MILDFNHYPDDSPVYGLFDAVFDWAIGKYPDQPSELVLRYEIEKERKKKSTNGLEERLSGEKPTIDSPRFTINPDVVYGYGSWGIVYSGKDELTGQNVAIKVFAPTPEAKAKMPHRGLDENKAMDKEATELSACSRVVPRRLEIDNNNRRFIVMPYYPKFLDNAIDWVTDNKKLDMLPFDSYSKDIATAYSEVHSREGLDRVHGDGHPGNFAINSQGHLLLNDFGSSTVEGMGMTQSPRDNVGWFFTRAPELFKKGSESTKQSDTYSASALIFKLKTGIYPLEGLTYNQIRDSSGEEINKHIRRVIDKEVTDKRLRKFFYIGLNVDPNKRFFNGSNLKDNLERALDKSYKINEFKKYSRRFGLGTLVLGGMISCGIYVSSQIPQRRVLSNQEVRGMLYQPKEEVYEGKKTNFESEKNPEYLDRETFDGMIQTSYTRHAKLASKDKIVAHFTKSYAQANSDARSVGLTDYQAKLFAKANGKKYDGDDPNMSPYFPTIVKSLEVAINDCRTADGKVDVEDAMVSALWGIDSVKELKFRSGSNDYSKYRNYMGEKNRTFVDTWLAYYHQDI